MAPQLPDDILYMVSAQLFDQREFNTLFNCSIASRALTIPALSNLYRMQDAAPVTSGGGDEGQTMGKDSIGGWAKLWRTLLLSSLDKTAFPYCRYIRVLDLNDLKDLLQDNKFRAEHSKTFFAGDLAPFLVEIDVPLREGLRKAPPKRLNELAIIEMIGEALSRKTPMVEELRADVSSDSLMRWIPRFEHLKHLRTWDGLRIAGAGALIRDKCPHFVSLALFQATGDADSIIAEFLDELRPNTFESLEIFSASSIEDDLFSSLNNHAEALTELKLGGLRKTSMLNLSKLKSCVALQKLQLGFRQGPRPNPQQLDACLPEIITWLQECKSLQELSFDNVDACAKILSFLLSHQNIHLTHLTVSHYDSSDNSAGFHDTLPNQSSSLRSLLLWAEGESCDADTLVSFLVKLTNLTELRLQDISNYFGNHHVIALANSMPLLEDLYVSGWRLTDAILSSLSSLSALRSLEMQAFSAFTLDGILDFISNLGPGCQGLNLGIMMADPNTPLSEAEQTLVRESLAARVGGKFNYELSRDPDAPDSDSDSD